MNIRRKTLTEMRGEARLQKALSLAIFIKELLGRNSTVHNYTINKLHELTHVSATTLKKYIPIIERQGWAHREGKNNQHLVFDSLSSRQKCRNVDISQFDTTTLRGIIKSLRALLALNIQARKDYMKRLLQTLSNPRNGKEFVSARKKVRQLVKRNILKSVDQTYQEGGLSYKRIAREIGCCEKTAFSTIAFAVKKGWVIKYHFTTQYYASNISYDKVEEYHFTTKDNAYISGANIYEIQDSFNRSFNRMA